MAERFVIGSVEVAPGERRSVEIPVAQHTHAEMFLPAHVVRGRQPGPHLFVCAAIHGDELNGVEVVRRLRRVRALRLLRGALICVPIVNVYGFIGQSRYLPDRRDLNRVFPGSPSGSLAARLAHRFMEEVVAHATHGVDLHTGSIHRSNLPHVRACLDDPAAEKLARAFGAPVILDANLRDGSLRQAVLEREIPVLVYEGGEALRFDELAIRAGLRGVLSVMRAIGMLPASSREKRTPEPFVARSSHWVRAPRSGILRTTARLGERVQKGERIGVVSDPVGDEETDVHASHAGILIGRTKLPLVNEGDALFHVATFDRPSRVEREVLAFREEFVD